MDLAQQHPSSSLISALNGGSHLYNRHINILKEKNVPLFPMALVRTYLKLNSGFFQGGGQETEENEFLSFSLDSARKLIEEQTQRSLVPKYIYLQHRNTRFELPLGPVVHVDKVFYNGKELIKDKEYTLRRSGETYVLQVLKTSLKRDRKVEVYYYAGYGAHGIPPQGILNENPEEKQQREEKRRAILENFMKEDKEPWFSQIPSILQNAVLRALDSIYYQRGQGWEEFAASFQEKTLGERQSASQDFREKKFAYLI